MKRLTSVSSAVCFLVLTGCATNRVAPAIPVQITVNGTTDIGGGLAGDVRFAAMTAIAHRVPNAPALKVAVTVAEQGPGDVITEPFLNNEGMSLYGQSQTQVPIPSLSPDPATGPRPMISTGGTGIPGQNAAPVAEKALRVSYTITDADGRLLETRQFMTNPYNSSVRKEIGQTADIIASRVQALSGTP